MANIFVCKGVLLCRLVFYCLRSFVRSVLSFPALAFCAGAFGEYASAYSYNRYKEIGFILFIFTLLVMGSFLNFTLFLCNK